ncbi:D-alanyl-D-alanine carboxypeptidase family protein [Neisseria sp. Ec49-e6-T10]|uniref:D-alanyl-D-alanine carboxypeptidase family protein n=1 Tax=Neisseria sp. Ec49-e6-T10 TaxID=3140744 RepID=UPI003EBE2F2B
MGLVLFSGFSIAQAAPIAPEIAAKAYLIEDVQSGQILSFRDMDQQIEPASLTKLMTAYLTFAALKEGHLTLEQKLTVSEKGWAAEGSRMFLDPKTPATVEDIVKGMIVQSGNDACITLAEAISGSEEAFVMKMNDQAKRLGMLHTNFTNSSGLPDPKLYTTLADLAILSKAIMRDFPEYYPIYSIKSFTYNNITQPNRNLLLFRDPSVDGLKTGHTESAGYNLIASSKRNGRRVLSIVVGTKNAIERANESSKLLNWALQFYETPKLYSANQVISKVTVYKGKKNELPIGFTDDVYATVPKGASKEISPVLETYQPALAPIQKGQKVGVLKVSYQGKLLYERPVVALEAVEEAGIFGRIWDSIILWFKSF